MANKLDSYNKDPVWYVYFAAGSYTSDGINLYNRYAVIYDDSVENAKERLKTYFPGVKAYLSQDKDTPNKFGLKIIELDYELQIKKDENNQN